jgi:hypothetical protein
MRKFVFLATLTASLAACGGGSLSTGSSTGTTSGTGTGGTSSSGSAAAVYEMGNGTGSSFQSGQIGISNANLSAGGTDSLDVSIVDQTGTLYTAASTTITISSSCISQGLASVAPSGATTAGSNADTFVTTTGTAQMTYTAKGCNGADVLTASAVVAGQSLTATGTITVAAATVGSIQFVSATPTTIGLKGTGLNETSTVVFKVLDATGAARPGVPVTFSLNTSVGGITLTPANATSANDGTVQTVVSSGTQHTAVRVTANIASPALSTQSSQLTVTTGLPAAAAFSIAVGPVNYGKESSVTLACPNVEAYSIDEVSSPIIVQLADRYNNPAPDGTAVAFTTNGGHIVGSCTTPLSTPGDGTCSANWTSANPRPLTSDDTPAELANGRVQILATAIGEESFTDLNGSGYYVQGDPFVSLGEPYRDDNENHQYDSGEYFLDFNNNGMRDPPSGVFIGITCTASSCSTSTLAIGVQQTMIMSTSNAGALLNFSVGGSFSGSAAGLSIPASQSGSISFQLVDENGNPMAAGTTISVSASASVSTSTGSATQGCSIAPPGTANANVYVFDLTAASAAGNGTLTITVTSPSLSQTIFSIPVNVT